MSSKSAQGKTTKYSGLVNKVHSSKEAPKDTVKEEPRLTEPQIRAAFDAFKIPLNDRNHHDLLVWSMRPQSDGPKLIEELSKKRKELNKEEDDAKKEQESKKSADDESKKTLPRLSDKELSDLHDEYGIPMPDPEWARNNMPNDPKKVRAILEVQRKTADDMIKKQSKNAVNAIPETPKSNPMMSMGGAPMMGKGGPTPPSANGDMIQDSGPINPFFIGDHSIVRITNPNNPDPSASTLWLVDAKKKVLRPFMSEQAFDNTFENPEEARKAIVTLSAKDLGPGGALAGFTPLQAGKGIQHDGSMDKIEFSPAELQNKYGKASDPQAEHKALSILDSVLGKLNPAGQPPQGSQQPTPVPGLPSEPNIPLSPQGVQPPQVNPQQ